MTVNRAASLTLACLALTSCSGSLATATRVSGPPATPVAAPASAPASSPAAPPQPPTSPKAPAATKAAPARLTPLWSVDLNPVSSPVVVAGRVVVYADDGDGMRLVAVDPADGHVAWQVTTTPSNTTLGQGIEPQPVGDGIAVLVPAGLAATQLQARVALLDARTGRIRWQSATPTTYEDQPEACDHDNRHVCVNPQDGPEQRYDATTGAEQPVVGTTSSGRDLGSGVRDDGTSAQRTLSFAADGRLRWRRPVTEMFRGADVSPDGGWDIGRYGSVLVISLGGPYTPGQTTADLAAGAMAGIDADTGRTLWVDRGSGLFCDGLEIYGHRRGVRCRTAGTVTATSDTTSVTRGLRTRIEGFDPRTGRTLWQVDAGDDPAFGSSGAAVTPVDDNRVVVGPTSARRVLDLRTGGVAAGAPGTTVWCGTEGTWYYEQQQSRISGPRTATTTWRPCTLSGGFAPPASPAPAVGVTAGTVYVWPALTGLRGARLPGRA